VTGLYIAPNGQITFAPGQTFPVTGSGGGTITGITTSSPLTGSGTTGSVALGLDTSALETTLNNVYAQLGTGNTFSSYLVASQTAGPGQAALLGRGTNGSIGTFGSSDTGYGLQGVSTSGFGVYAQVAIPAAGSAGVLGSTGTTFSTTYSSEAGIADAGVWADNAGTAGSGVPVALFATADNAYGGAFMNNSAEAPALFATNGTGPGAQFTATAGNGVYGQTSGGGNGVEGFNNSTGEQQAGVEGVANVTSTVGASYNVYGGVWGDTGTSSTAVAPAWAIGVLGTADDSYAGVFLNNSANFPTLFAENYAAGGATGLASGGIFKTFMATSEDGTCGIGRGGSLSCTGQIKSLVSAGNGARTVETYAPQSAENWMEDYGTGTMEQGVAVVKIDLAFAETASETPDYHVFITPNADSKGLYVINKTATSFEVRESGGGVSSLTFDYKIVAKRRGYEAQRLVDVTERFNTEMKARSIHKGPAAVDKPAMPLHATLGAHLHPLALQQLPVPLKQMDRPANAPTKP
jgi:hypothetical protein